MMHKNNIFCPEKTQYYMFPKWTKNYRNSKCFKTTTTALTPAVIYNKFYSGYAL